MCRTVVYYAKTCRMIFFQPTLLVKNIAKNKSPPKLEAKAIEKSKLKHYIALSLQWLPLLVQGKRGGGVGEGAWARAGLKTVVYFHVTD